MVHHLTPSFDHSPHPAGYDERAKGQRGIEQASSGTDGRISLSFYAVSFQEIRVAFAPYDDGSGPLEAAGSKKTDPYENVRFPAHRLIGDCSVHQPPLPFKKSTLDGKTYSYVFSAACLGALSAASSVFFSAFAHSGLELAFRKPGVWRDKNFLFDNQCMAKVCLLSKKKTQHMVYAGMGLDLPIRLKNRTFHFQFPCHKIAGNNSFSICQNIIVIHGLAPFLRASDFITVHPLLLLHAMLQYFIDSFLPLMIGALLKYPYRHSVALKGRKKREAR